MFMMTLSSEIGGRVQKAVVLLLLRPLYLTVLRLSEMSEGGTVRRGYTLGVLSVAYHIFR